MEKWYSDHRGAVLLGCGATSAALDGLFFFVLTEHSFKDKLGERAIAALVTIALFVLINHLDKESTIEALTANPDLSDTNADLADIEVQPGDKNSLRAEIRKKNLAVIVFRNESMGTEVSLREREFTLLVGAFPLLLLPVAFEKIQAIHINKLNAQRGSDQMLP